MRMKFTHGMYPLLSSARDNRRVSGDNIRAPGVDRNEPDQLSLARKTLTLR